MGPELTVSGPGTVLRLAIALLAFANTSSALDPATVGRRSFQRTMCTTSAGSCQPIQLVKASRGTHCPFLLLDYAMLLLRVKGRMVWRQRTSLNGFVGLSRSDWVIWTLNRSRSRAAMWSATIHLSSASLLNRHREADNMDVKEPQPLVGEKGGVAHDELPPPTTATTPKKYRETLLKRLLFVGVMAVCFSALRPIVFRQPSNGLVDLTDIDDGGYWAAVASKGMRMALPWSGHHEHHHHGDDAHSHSMHPPLGRPPHLIPPKMAEHIFLSVPNNGSAREYVMFFLGWKHS